MGGDESSGVTCVDSGYGTGDNIFVLANVISDHPNLLPQDLYYFALYKSLYFIPTTIPQTSTGNEFDIKIVPGFTTLEKKS